MIKTKSHWGSPPSRYYNFLKRVEREFNSPSLMLAVLGCSDGKFVLPAARKGYSVLAVDIDEVAIFGGKKKGPQGEVFMEGIISRLKQEKLEQQVRVVNCDFMEVDSKVRYHAVWTSGALNYSFNLKHNIRDMIEKVKSFVLPKGFLYFDYMLPIDPIHFNRENYFSKGALVKFFDKKHWKVVYDMVLPPLMEKGHVDLPVDHYHHWGHLCVQSKV